MAMIRYLIILSIIVPLSYNKNIFTSIVDLQSLITTVRNVSSTLQSYTMPGIDRIKNIQSLYNDYAYIASMNDIDIETFVSHPLNAFIIIKRLTQDYEILKTDIESEVIVDILNHMNETNIFPAVIDFRGAATGLFRLQNVYDINPNMISDGTIRLHSQNKTINHIKPSSSDMYELGKHFNGMKQYSAAILWFIEALKRLNHEESKLVENIDVYDHIANATMMLKDIESDSRKIKNESIFEHFSQNSFKQLNYRSYEQLYKLLCQRKNLMSPPIASRLKCYYYRTHDKFYMRYMRIKAEKKYSDPDILLFHDVISEREIGILRNLSMDNLLSANIPRTCTKKNAYVTYRIGKTAWLIKQDYDITKELYQRVNDIIGLTFDSAENLQIANYGIGGQYDPHYDFDVNKTSGEAGKYGRRMATWMWYLSEVDEGGSTVFPLVNVSVEPVKGSALFWYNLDENLDGDPMTWHAGCPVLVGNKWVANAWFRSKGNELNRPCGLEPPLSS